MIEQLFGSKTRIKLLGLFYQNPDRSFYVREMTRKIDEQINSVRRELANLLSIGIISSDNSTNKLYYQVNKDFEHYDALASMFGGRPLPKENSSIDLNNSDDAVKNVEKQFNDFTDEHVNRIVKSGNVRTLIYTGQFTRDPHIGVDIVIIGDINLPNLEHAVERLEESEKKQIAFSVFTPEEFHYRKQVNDRFMSNLLNAKKIIHLDRDSLLG